MPFYHAVVRPGTLDEPARQAFANDVVETHCGVTGAPPSFVHVLFSDDTTGRLDGELTCSVVGTIRSGRTDAQKALIVDGLRSAFAGRAAVDPTTVAVSTRDIEASFTMEGGALLPEPGSPEEDAWKQGSPAA